MRTRTPFRTCLVMSDEGRSAASGAISTPRFIGPGCITSTRSSKAGGSFPREPETMVVLVHRRHECGLGALFLDAQEIDDVERVEHAVEVGSRSDGPAVEGRRQQRSRPDEHDLGSERRHGEHVGSGDAAVADVADDADPQAAQVLRGGPTGRRALEQRFADRVAVEERLGRVLMLAVAAVDDAGARPGTHLRGNAGGLVAHDHRIDPHGVDRLDGVAQRLALFQRGRGGTEGHDVG